MLFLGSVYAYVKRGILLWKPADSQG